MAYTNAQLVRREAGDRGVYARDTDSGDGSATEFWLSAPPIVANSQTVKVGGTTYTEVASAPGASQYTLDDDSGRLIFGVAPGSGTDNVEATYRTAELADADVTEALRQFGLTDTAEADTGPVTALLEAAAMLCDWQAAAHAGDVDTKTDGQEFKRSHVSERWIAQAAAIRTRLQRERGLVSAAITRVDGYSQDVSSRDVGTTATNPRRNFYGQPDAPF
jgi:hypothetical protein